MTYITQVAASAHEDWERDVARQSTDSDSSEVTGMDRELFLASFMELVVAWEEEFDDPVRWLHQLFDAISEHTAAGRRSMRRSMHDIPLIAN